MASIRRRVRKDGSTSYAVLWRDADTQTQTSHTVEAEAEADILKRLLDANGQSFSLVERLLSDPNVSGPTVARLVELHIGELTRASVGTKEKYRNNTRLHILERLGHLRVSEVTHTHMVEWVQWMQERGKSAKTIANVHGLISAAFNTAIIHQMRPDNPCAHVSLPQRSHSEDVTTFLTREEFDLVYDSTPEHWKTMMLFLVSTGLRFGETNALKFSDLELDAAPAVVRVQRAWKEGERGEFYLGAPKSRRSRRKVSIHGDLAWRLASLPRDSDDDFVFQSPTGNVVWAWTFHEQAWRRALTAARLADPRFTKTPRPHDLRHTHASWMLRAGMNIVDLSRRLGHENVAITTDLYSHEMPAAQHEAVAALDRAFDDAKYSRLQDLPRPTV